MLNFKMNTRKLALIATLWASSAAVAAADFAVTKVDKLTVDIAGGQVNGLAAGDDLCFANTAGVKSVCGKVSKVVKTKARITLNAGDEGKVKVGDLAKSEKAGVTSAPSAAAVTLPAGTAAPATGTDKAVVATTPPLGQTALNGKAHNPPIAGKDVTTVTPPPATVAGAVDSGTTSESAPVAVSEAYGKLPRKGIAFSYVYTPLSPTVYENLSYKAVQFGSSNAGRSSSWQTNGNVKASLIGFQGSFFFANGPTAIWNIGLRFRTFPTTTKYAEYIEGNNSQYVKTVHSANAFGLIFEWLKQKPITDAITLNFGGGLDIERSGVSVKSTRYNDGTNASDEIANATSSVMTFSARGTGSATYWLTKGGIDLGVHGLLPLFNLASAVTGSFADPALGSSVDAAADFKTSAKHKKAVYGAEVTLGYIYPL